MRRCTTHHHACTCREAKFAELERENAEMKVRCESLRQSHEKQIDALERENAALRADKERLDWLGKVKCAYYHEGPCCWRINEDESTDGETIRAAIDAARKANDE